MAIMDAERFDNLKARIEEQGLYNAEFGDALQADVSIGELADVLLALDAVTAERDRLYDGLCHVLNRYCQYPWPDGTGLYARQTGGNGEEKAWIMAVDCEEILLDGAALKGPPPRPGGIRARGEGE